MRNLLLAALVCVLPSSLLAQSKSTASIATVSANDTLDIITQPVKGFRLFARDLEAALSDGETEGKKFRIRIDNIGFFVSKTGTIDSAWILFRPRHIHREIIKVLKSTTWRPAEKDGQKIVSRQELLDFDIFLTKAALKKQHYWRTLPERIISPYSR